jgi:type I restriction enzyme, R subunit
LSAWTFTQNPLVEQAALTWLEDVGWKVRNGAEIAPGEFAAERDDYGQVVLAQRLRDALARLNPTLPAEALEDAFRKLTRPAGADLIKQTASLIGCW